MGLRRFAIGTRLYGGFAIVFVLLAGLGVALALQAEMIQSDLSLRLLTVAGQGPAAAAITAELGHAAASRHRLMLWAALAGAIVLLLSVALVWLLGRSITRPLQAAVSIARRVASGDLSSQTAVAGDDEISALLHALQDMNGNLLKIVGEVRSGTNAISTASGQIASGNDALSSHTEAQASSLQQTALAGTGVD